MRRCEPAFLRELFMEKMAEYLEVVMSTKQVVQPNIAQPSLQMLYDNILP